MEQIIIPDRLTFNLTGQSGAGKDTAKELLAEICEENAIPYICPSSGKFIREYCEGNFLFSKEIRQLNSRGSLSPEFIPEAMVMHEIMHASPDTKVIIINGGPRTSKQVDTIYEWSKSGLFGVMKTIETIAPNEICLERILKDEQRTDRPDSDNKETIENKMAWWTNSREEIVRKLISFGMYVPIHNTEDLASLKKKLRGLLVSF